MVRGMELGLQTLQIGRDCRRRRNWKNTCERQVSSALRVLRVYGHACDVRKTGIVRVQLTNPSSRGILEIRYRIHRLTVRSSGAGFPVLTVSAPTVE